MDQSPHGPAGIRARREQEILQADGRGPEIRVGGIESERQLERQQLTGQHTASLDGVDGIIGQQGGCFSGREEIRHGLGRRERPRHPFWTPASKGHTLREGHIEQGLQGAHRVVPRTFIGAPASLGLGPEVADLNDTVLLGLTEQRRGGENEGDKQRERSEGHGPCTRATPIRFHPGSASSRLECSYIYKILCYIVSY